MKTALLVAIVCFAAISYAQRGGIFLIHNVEGCAIGALYGHAGRL